MDTKRFLIATMAAALVAVAGPVRGQDLMGTAFTYQGELKDAGSAVTDTCDLEFSLWDAPSAGSQVGATLAYADVDVLEGLVSEQLDFGVGACTGEKRYLELTVKCSGDADFVVLGPRQELTPAPYAMHSDHAVTADSVPGGIIGAGAGDYLPKFTSPDEIGQSVLYESAGKIGIGTTSPNATLELRGSNAALRSASTSEPDIRWTELVYHPSVGPLLWGGAYPKLTLDALSGSAGSIVLGRNGDKIGIGTDAPSQRLTLVDGNLSLKVADNVNEQAILFQNSGAGYTWRVFRSDAGSNAADLHIAGGPMAGDPTSLPDRMTFASDGKVGIGTTSPTSKLTVNGIIESTAGGIKFPDGSVQGTAGGGGGSGWSLTGNAGTTPGTNFLGTTDNQALELKVNNMRAMRLVSDGTSVQVIGGSSGNAITPDSSGATIAGGGHEYSGHTIAGGYSTISGGVGNQITGGSSIIGGGTRNIITGESVVIGGGHENDSATWLSVIGGGVHNRTMDGSHSVIGGGSGNTTMGGSSVIGGGMDNRAGASGATVPGGSENTADGQFSFAAGRRANAMHNGSFVWADHGDSSCVSQHDDQFRVCAEGGARFDDGGHWVEIRNDYANLIKTSTGARLTLAGVWTNTSDRNLKEDVEPVDGRDVLDRLSQLPLSTWKYTIEQEGVRHMGPMAQDFYQAFELGDSDTSIGTVDADGVALTAIQALHQVVLKQGAQIAALQERIAGLEDYLGLSADDGSIGGAR